MSPAAVLRLRGVDVVEGTTAVLGGVDWTVERGQHWIVLGPNGSGKTSLVRVASLYRHPTRGSVEVLGERLGTADVRSLRRRIGLASHALGDQLRGRLTAREAVMTGRHAALEPWWHTYDDADRDAAATELGRWGLAARVDHPLQTLSAGERQRVLLARAFAGSPGIVLLDEPTAGLDLGGREDLVSRLAERARAPDTPPVVLVTHHVEEIPVGFTHALLMDRGRISRQGEIAAVVTSEALSELFGLALDLHVELGRHRVTAVS